VSKILSTVRTALPAVAACAITLGGLYGWTASGAAGCPADIGVTDARILLPFGDGEQTAAVFRLRNTGGADDDLVAVTSPETGRALLAHTVVHAGGGSMSMTDSATVPARGTLTMSPFGLDVMVNRPPRLRPGQLVPFVLHFRDSTPVRVAAVVVRPQDATS
jgi:copper(I)-binding protein